VQRAQSLHDILTQYQVQIAGVDRMTLISRVSELMDADAAFRDSVTSQLRSTGNTVSAGGSITATHGVVAGGNVSDSNNTDIRNVGNKKNHFGGILVAVVAVVALFLVGKQVISTITENGNGPSGNSRSGGPALTGSSTCRDFLAADPATQTDVLKRVYLAAGREDLAGDPFILQNGQYRCGQAPGIKLERLAR
jgi:hypothetical protein